MSTASVKWVSKWGGGPLQSYLRGSTYFFREIQLIRLHTWKIEHPILGWGLEAESLIIMFCLGVSLLCVWGDGGAKIASFRSFDILSLDWTCSVSLATSLQWYLTTHNHLTPHMCTAFHFTFFILQFLTHFFWHFQSFQMSLTLNLMRHAHFCLLKVGLKSFSHFKL